MRASLRRRGRLSPAGRWTLSPGHVAEAREARVEVTREWTSHGSLCRPLLRVSPPPPRPRRRGRARRSRARRRRADARSHAPLRPIPASGSDRCPRLAARFRAAPKRSSSKAILESSTRARLWTEALPDRGSLRDGVRSHRAALVDRLSRLARGCLTCGRRRQPSDVPLRSLPVPLLRGPGDFRASSRESSSAPPLPRPRVVERTNELRRTTGRGARRASLRALGGAGELRASSSSPPVWPPPETVLAGPTAVGRRTAPERGESPRLRGRASASRRAAARAGRGGSCRSTSLGPDY